MAWPEGAPRTAAHPSVTCHLTTVNDIVTVNICGDVAPEFESVPGRYEEVHGNMVSLPSPAYRAIAPQQHRKISVDQK